MNMNVPMTVYGKKKLEEELEKLIKVDREEIKTALAEARALGDLKENAEYHAAKEAQGHNEGRIAELQSKIANSQVVDTSKLSGDKIVFGAIVTIYDGEKDASQTFQIVGEDEAIESKEKVSYSSPLGKALIGRESGDEIIVKAPKGDISYEVENVEYK